MSSVAHSVAHTARAASADAGTRTGEAGNSIVFEAVTVAYRGFVVLDRLSLDVAPGEIVALIGPSGSGKTTALRAVAGFVRPASGRIRIGDVDVTDLPPYARGIGMVVQNYALFPHLRVAENVAFGLQARGAAREMIAARVPDCLRLVGMSQYAGRYPRELSGGQQQRVAIARALAIRPRVLLLDEPLSALDAQIRRGMVEELAKLHRDLPNLTVLYVTHDQVEALTLADRIAIMRDGKLCSHGRSRDLYRAPPNRFTADFLGRANLLPVTIDSIDRPGGTAHVRFGATVLTAEANPMLNGGDKALVCVRPHDVTPDSGGSGANAIDGIVESVQWQGDSHTIVLDARGTLVRMVCVPLRDPPERGAAMRVSFAADRATLIPDEPA